MRGRSYLRLTGAVLLAAMTAYAAASLSSGDNGTPETVTVSAVTVSESISAEGIIVRREICIGAQDGFHTVAADRARVSGGSVIAADSAGLKAMDAQLRAERLELTQTVSEAELYAAVHELAKAKDTITRKNAEAVISAALGFPPESAEEAEADGEYILAPCAGTFYKRTDGYEKISSGMLSDITVPELRRLINSYPEETKRIMGKLLPSGDFCFAALIDEADASRLGEELYIDLGTGEEYSAALSYLSLADGGLCAAVFRCDADSTKTAELRLVTAKIICRSFSGIRIPREAINADGEGGYTVCAVSPTGETELAVDIIYEGNKFCLAAESGSTDGLREGMSVIIKR